jgi:predicted dehydrogenase
MPINPPLHRKLRMGLVGGGGFIGRVHAIAATMDGRANLARFVTGLSPREARCLLESFTGGLLDDYGSAVLRFHGGALGTVTASRVSHGRENDLGIEVDGTRAALSWRQEEPNQMLLRANGKPQRILTRNPAAASTAAAARFSCRLPAGHPEGFLEAFANVYTAAFEDMIARAAGATRADCDPQARQVGGDGGRRVPGRQARLGGGVHAPEAESLAVRPDEVPVPAADEPSPAGGGGQQVRQVRRRARLRPPLDREGSPVRRLRLALVLAAGYADVVSRPGTGLALVA